MDEETDKLIEQDKRQSTATVYTQIKKCQEQSIAERNTHLEISVQQGRTEGMRGLYAAAGLQSNEDHRRMDDGIES